MSKFLREFFWPTEQPSFGFRPRLLRWWLLCGFLIVPARRYGRRAVCMGLKPKLLMPNFIVGTYTCEPPCPCDGWSVGWSTEMGGMHFPCYIVSAQLLYFRGSKNIWSLPLRGSININVFKAGIIVVPNSQSQIPNIQGFWRERNYFSAPPQIGK